jgi:Fe-S oxidoreductase
MRIGLFIPCYIDAFFAEVGIATLELLERFGHEVVYPHDQTCCGQPMANSGFNAESTDTEARFVRNIRRLRLHGRAVRQLRRSRARQFRRDRKDRRSGGGAGAHLRTG